MKRFFLFAILLSSSFYFSQDPTYILDERRADEAERRHDEFWDCVDRGDCDPSDYPSPDSNFFDIILVASI